MSPQEQKDKVLSTLFAVQTYLEAERTERISRLGGTNSVQISPLAQEVDKAISILLGREEDID